MKKRFVGIIICLILAVLVAVVFIPNKKRQSVREADEVSLTEEKYLFLYPEINHRDRFEKLDTDELLASCLLYPSLPYYAAETRKQAIEHMLDDFAGLQEYMKREDRLETAESFDIEKVDFSHSGEYQKNFARQFLKNLILYMKGELPDGPS